MLKHIVMWNVADPSEDNIAFLKQTFYSMKEHIDEVTSVTVAQDIGSGHSNRDLVLITTHPGKKEFLIYQEHPYHQHVKQKVSPFLSNRSSCDVEA